MPGRGIHIVEANGVTVWRVGRAPDPWSWVDPHYAGHNRWDDADGQFRTIYAADSLYTCYVEVLAFARPDVNADGSMLLDEIEEEPADAAEFPVPRPGLIPRDWISCRMIGIARLDGSFADVRNSETIATLRPTFLELALDLGYSDFDAASLKSAHPRTLTQRVAGYLYTLGGVDASPLIDGVRFASRHGDEMTMWAIFERPGDEPASRRLRQGPSRLVTPADPELTRAMTLHNLTWR